MSTEQVEGRSPAAVRDNRGGIGYLLKTALRKTVRIIPGGEHVIEPALRNMRLQFRRWRWAQNAGNATTSAQDNQLTLDPALIQLCPAKEFAYRDFKGGTEGGDWDLSDKAFENLDVYNAFNEVCKQKTKSWQETDYYKNLLAEIEGGKEIYRCRNKADFDARCKKLTALYESIANDGYKTQAELQTTQDDEVAVAIGRNGQIFFSDGAHRLSIAKLLGLKEIPVLVSVRHPEWAAFKAQVIAFTQTQVHKCLYQQALHPDLLSIPAEHGCADRFNAIEPKLPVRSGNLLDIGSNLGYMCHRFEDLGFDCTGVEIDETHQYFMEKLRDAANKKFKICFSSFLDEMELTTHDYEVVLALNIFHHFLKEEELHKKLVAFLNRLTVNHIIFEAHLPIEVQMETAYRNYPPDEFCAFIMEHTGLSKKELLYQAHDGREMFLLSR